MLDACAEFWWSIYEHKPYVHPPDTYPTVNTPPIGKEYFVKRLKAGLSGCDTQHWAGEVTDDSIVLAEDGGKVEGILVCSIDREKLIGNILSAYMQRDARGREIADRLLSEALDRFRKMRLRRVVAGVGGKMEVQCPIHLALLDAGFSWQKLWWDYCVWLGGSLEGFRLQPEIMERIEKLRKEGVTFERCVKEQSPSLRWMDDGREIKIDDKSHCAFIAFVNGIVVGCTFEVMTWEEEGEILCMVGPAVSRNYRRRGIGKVLQHLGTEEAVRQGARYGFNSTEIHNPARLVYQSVGFRYWYTDFGRMLKHLR